ncbi:acyltransferase [Rhodococcus maanshanensis]|uniref:Uncharacterized protein n=1 Tax=Rhodococcus maanshanensis TaxID=183556 RepID=A0A1H7F7Y4_9NOCA|nr:acyltransferase [Rhodococcus maanshanensis]SEK19315.1 hypothetical protein SAMN05444583_1013 [Rhodococcus maanshanensis]
MALGEAATVSRGGTKILEVSNTSLSTDGCAENTKLPGEVTKQLFNATVATGPATATQWLWPSDFYYVDAAGKIAKNVDASDANPCTGSTSTFIDMPTNSAADGKVTLDVPNVARVIGYHTTQGGNDVRIEWVLPEVPATAPAPAAPAAPSAPAVLPSIEAAPADSAAEPPVGFTGAPIGEPAPLVGKVIDHCMTGSMYQTGTTMFTDGTTGWTQQCASGG